jgi:hypothetical protein
MKKFSDQDTGFTTSEDKTCGVVCSCGYEDTLWVSDREIVRCPECGRGYRTEFLVWVFEPGED